MNEKVINTVISNYAMEVANLRIQVATLSAELEDLQTVQDTEENKEEK